MKLHRIILITLTLTVGFVSVHAQHSHLNAGASSHDQDAPLIFVNGAELSAESGFQIALQMATEGIYTGYFQGGLTFTSLPGTLETGGPDPDATAPGAVVAVEMLRVAGPDGGVFAFWEAGATEPSHELPVGAPGVHQWLLSESDGSPGADPFGHIHGRRWTATRPGIYDVVFRLVDVSANGVGGGPLHSPSETLTLRFVAGDGEELVVLEDGNFVISAALQGGSLVTSLLENDGHTGHAHDSLDPARHVFRVASHVRGHVVIGEDHLGAPGSRKWELSAKKSGAGGHAHASTISAAHAHPNTLPWDGDQNPLTGLRVVKDAVKGWNVFIDTVGFTFSPENAGGSHVVGEGHAHIYVDGVKLGRVYGGAYYLAALELGEHVVRVTLNANSHADYTFDGQPIEESVAINQPEETGHSHSTTIEWEGEVKPTISTSIQTDPVSGWNLLLDTEDFTFAPEHASGDHIRGEGHAHIYVNGTKLTRLYGDAFHLGSLPAGVVTVRVGLSANNHADYTISGALLGDSVVIVNGEQPRPVTSPTLGISAGAVFEGPPVIEEVTVALVGVQGPGEVALLSNDHILANTRDGIGAEDAFALPVSQEIPVAWVFSAPGDHVVSLRFEAELARGGALASVVDVRFQVDGSERLEHAFLDGQLHVTWDTGQVLEWSSTLGGSYEDVAGIEGHLTVEPGAGSGFYRLKNTHGHALHE